MALRQAECPELGPLDVLGAPGGQGGVSPHSSGPEQAQQPVKRGNEEVTECQRARSVFWSRDWQGLCLSARDRIGVCAPRGLSVVPGRSSLTDRHPSTSSF